MPPVSDDFAAELVGNRDPRQHVAKSQLANRRGDERAAIKWAREFFAATAPHATGGVYVNFMPEDETERVPGAYGSNYTRLAALKAKYDPDNLFRLNQNVQPKA